jgi:glutamate/tyrosine decarboxylase-like PLP-dependent enzyme
MDDRAAPLHPDLAALRATCDSPLDHPDLGTLRQFAELTVDWALRHEAGLFTRPVGRSATPAELDALLAEPAPWSGAPFEDVLAKFERDVVPYTYPPSHPRFLAFIPGATTFVGVLGDWLCAAGNFFAGVWFEAAGPARVELLVLDWFRELLGLPQTASGILTGGGSEATLTALVVARERISVADRPRAVLYVGGQRHWSVDRGARIIGVLPERIRAVEVDERLRLCPDDLARKVREDRAAGLLPWVVVATAGTTNTGAVDPLPAIAELCERERLWLHVDAAFGWAACLTPDGRELLAGIERADSVTFDPHKWLAQPFEVGGLLVRHRECLEQAFQLRPEYMQDVEPDQGEVNFADRGIALSRRFRALKVWLSIKVLGLGWFARLVEHGRSLGRYAEAKLIESGFEIVSGEQLALVCFRDVLPDWDGEAQDRHNRALLDAVRASGEAFLSSTRVNGRVAMRFCLINWRTSAADVDRVIAALLELKKKL